MATYSGTGLDNSIAARTEMIKTRMDDIVYKETVTSAMNASPDLVEAFHNSKTASLLTPVIPGLGNYSKVSGYPYGSVEATWEEYTLAHDRAIMIDIDRRDTLETGGLVSAASIAARITRQKIIPEVDSARISGVVSKVSSYLPDHVVEGATPTASDILTKIGEGLDVIFEEYNVDSGATIYMNNKLRNVLRASTEYTKVRNIQQASRSLDLDTQSIDGNQIVYVPTARMKTAYSYDDPSSTAGSGGISPTTDAVDIDFLIVAPDCAQGVTVINSTKVIPAEQHQTKDADSFAFRIYHDVIVQKNEGAYGIYAYTDQAGA